MSFCRLNIAYMHEQSTQGFHGLVQRLVQKEKQVLQLQNELDRLKAQNPVDKNDSVCPAPNYFLGYA